MIRQSLLAIIFTGLAAGCGSNFFDWSIGYPTVVLRKENGFSVISEQHKYAREGGVTEFGVIQFKLNGRTINNEVISKALFPESSRCHSSFYEINDIRLLPDNAVLALMSNKGSYCETGDSYLAKISSVNNRLHVQRIPVVIAGEERGVDGFPFYRKMTEGYGTGFSGNEDRLAVQRGAEERTVGVSTAGKVDAPSRMVLIDLHSLESVDMGEGEIDRFVEGDSIALMRQLIRQETTQGVEFKAVRVSDGATVDRARYPCNCFRAVGPAAKDKAGGELWGLLREEQANAELARRLSGAAVAKVDSGRVDAQAPSTTDIPEVEFDSDKLSGIYLRASNYAMEHMLLGQQTRLDWDVSSQRIKVAPSAEIRQIKACRLPIIH